MQQRVSLIVYPWTGNNVTKSNWYYLKALYTLEAACTEDHELLFVCNQFVYSYVFSVACDERERLTGVLCASDRQRHKALINAQIDQIADLCDRAGNDYLNDAGGVLNLKSSDYDVVATVDIDAGSHWADMR